MATAYPSSQKADQCPITFALLRKGALVDSKAIMTMVIRPEELRRTDASRVNPQQTMGGAWADSFGVGMPRITINGHTGWRGTAREDGFALYSRLREWVYYRWHAERADAQAHGQDPDTVELVFTDTLNGYAVVVTPDQFQLRRSKTRPLLYQYDIQMTVLRDATAPVPPGDNELLSTDFVEGLEPSPGGAATDALSAAASRQRGLAQTIRDTFAPEMSAVSDLADASAGMLDQVNALTADAVTSFQAVTAPAIIVARQVQQASQNISQALIQPLALPQLAQATVMDIASSFGEAYCNLTNNFGNVGRYLDFSALYGASNCSSTTGGRPQTPYVDDNPFFDLYDNTGNPRALLSNDAAAAVTEACADPLVLRQRPAADLLGLARRISGGVQ